MPGTALSLCGRLSLIEVLVFIKKKKKKKNTTESEKTSRQKIRQLKPAKIGWYLIHPLASDHAVLLGLPEKSPTVSFIGKFFTIP